MTLKEIAELDDLISRWEAIKAVMDDENITNAMDSVNDGEMHRTKRAASRIIAGLPSAQQWIPCRKKLPRAGKNVLISMDDYNVTVGRIVTFGGKKLWQIDLGEYPIETFTAWMPLPKPYEKTE